MVTRVLLFALLLFFLVRAVRGLLVGIAAGAARSGTRRRGPQPSEHMVRDPVCGTFVLPSRAIAVGRGADARYFCSEQCRTAYLRQPDAGPALRP